ncbi:MAG: ribonuclease HII [Candidatus Marinimicrobia bacterium]|nr:ribonuclease HII [Candidatus Neomarinimicrobiota bacterium]
MEQQIISLYDIDNKYRSDHGCVIGVDEAGRGPLAGPVTAAAVYFSPDKHSELIRDSKKLSEKQRETAYEWIVENADGWAVHSIGVQAINKINILQASLVAMQRAVEKTGVKDAHVLIDGTIVPAALRECAHPVPGGDGISFCIAAASVLAKVTRDRIMKRWAEIYPEYGFERHKGYGTSMHLKAIETNFPTPIHRGSFSPVKNIKFPEYPDKKFLGRWGENWAIYYLILKGYHFISRNYYGGKNGEIDIIMRENDVFIMIEVKSAFGKSEYEITERVSEEKIQKMLSAAEHYFYNLNISEYNVRFDAVTVSGRDSNMPHIEHYKNII